MDASAEQDDRPYLVSKNVKTINQYLAQYLPKYMLIDHTINVKHLPLSANGKIDGRKLASQVKEVLTGQLETSSVAREGEEPLTSTKIALAKLWTEVLDGCKQSHITTLSCFFELGGHSLLAIGLKGSIERHLGIMVPLKEIFKQPF